MAINDVISLEGSHILPIPSYANKDQIIINGEQPKLYPYRNDNGEVLFYIAVICSKVNGEIRKDVRPVCWWRKPNGQEKWEFKHPISIHRPLLNLPNIISNIDKTIIIGEGEKTAGALSKLFPKYVATTSSGGALSANKSDWSIVKDRNVILSLDYDDPGKAYGRAIFQLCSQAGAASIKLLRVEHFGNYSIKNDQVIESASELPKGYDLADALEEGWTSKHLETLKEILISKNLSLLEDYENELSTAVPLYENEYEWGEPIPIKNDLLPVEALLLSMVPEPLQSWSEDISHRMQCPLEHVVTTAILMIASIIGAGCGIKPKKNDDWLINPNLWGGIIGNPSTLKSPAMAEALKPLSALEEKERKKFEKNKEEHDLELEAHKILRETTSSKIKKSLKSQSSSHNIQDIKDQLRNSDKPNDPIWKRFKTNDATVEKLTEILQENPKGILIFRDELMALLVKWDKEGHESDRAFFLEAWNASGSHTTDRIGRGTTHCSNMCISILGSTQPSKILGYLHRTIHNIENDGLFQRFQMLVYPDEQKVWQLIDKTPNKQAQQEVFKIIETIAYMNFAEYGASYEEDQSPYFQFCEEAQELFYEWLTELEQNKLRGNEDQIIVEHLAKYRKLMPALALIFHIIDIASGTANGSVSLKSAEKAAAWCDFLEQHAKRIYGLVTNIAPQAALALVKKIENGDIEDGFTVRDVYRKGWSLLGEQTNAQLACDELVKLGWLKERVTQSTQGQKGTTQYLINPKVRS